MKFFGFFVEFFTILMFTLNLVSFEKSELIPNYYPILSKSSNLKSLNLFEKYCKCDGSEWFPIIECKNITNQTLLKIMFDILVNFKINKFGKFSLTDSSINTIDTYFVSKNIGFEFISIKTTSLVAIDINVFIDSFPILKRLEIIHNNLKVLPFDGKSEHRIGVQHLDLYYNSLTTIPDNAFEKLRELKTIDLSFNSISYVGSFAFYFNDKLEYLDLKYNRLKVLNNYAFALSQPNHKLTLDLTNNKMFYLSEGVFSRQSPLLLNLTSNSLTKLEEKHFWPILKEIVAYNGFILVYNNHFECFCERIGWILKLSDEYKRRIIGFSCIDWNNKNLYEIGSHSFDCRQ